jgi:protein-S-isoprenylcysteine O-methyltransferase Ste14
VTTDPATGSAASEQPDPAATPTVTAGDADLAAPAVPFLQRRAAPRRRIESLFVRLIATSGIIGISVALAAILGTQSVQSWIIGLTVSAVSVVLAAVLWSSRTL